MIKKIIAYFHNRKLAKKLNKELQYFDYLYRL